MCVRPCYIHQCSAECGQGNRTRTTVCLMNHVTDLPLDSCEGEHPVEVTSCDSGPCQNRLEWYTGPWGQVIKTHTYILYNHHPHSMLPYKCVCVCVLSVPLSVGMAHKPAAWLVFSMTMIIWRLWIHQNVPVCPSLPQLSPAD